MSNRIINNDWFLNKKKGVRMGMTRMGPITFQQPVQCRDCDGEGNEKEEIHPRQFLHWIGEIIAHKDKCHKCQGNKIIEETKNLEVVILPGYSAGKKIKFREENDRLVRNSSTHLKSFSLIDIFQPGMEAGDVFILIEQEKHSLFERINDHDLLVKMTINLNESLTGFKRTLQHLDGRHVLIQHPPNQPIAPSLFSLLSLSPNDDCSF